MSGMANLVGGGFVGGGFGSSPWFRARAGQVRVGSAVMAADC
jgi:hypothetical protein